MNSERLVGRGFVSFSRVFFWGGWVKWGAGGGVVVVVVVGGGLRAV